MKLLLKLTAVIIISSQFNTGDVYGSKHLRGEESLEGQERPQKKTHVSSVQDMLGLAPGTPVKLLSPHASQKQINQKRNQLREQQKEEREASLIASLRKKRAKIEDAHATPEPKKDDFRKKKRKKGVQREKGVQARKPLIKNYMGLPGSPVTPETILIPSKYVVTSGGLRAIGLSTSISVRKDENPSSGIKPLSLFQYNEYGITEDTLYPTNVSQNKSPAE